MMYAMSNKMSYTRIEHTNEKKRQLAMNITILYKSKEAIFPLTLFSADFMATFATARKFN